MLAKKEAQMNKLQTEVQEKTQRIDQIVRDFSRLELKIGEQHEEHSRNDARYADLSAEVALLARDYLRITTKVNGGEDSFI